MLGLLLMSGFDMKRCRAPASHAFAHGALHYICFDQLSCKIFKPAFGPNLLGVHLFSEMV